MSFTCYIAQNFYSVPWWQMVNKIITREFELCFVWWNEVWDSSSMPPMGTQQYWPPPPCDCCRQRTMTAHMSAVRLDTTLMTMTCISTSKYKVDVRPNHSSVPLSHNVTLGSFSLLKGPHRWVVDVMLGNSHWSLTVWIKVNIRPLETTIGILYKF